MPPKRTASVRESQEFEEGSSQEAGLNESTSKDSTAPKRPRKDNSSTSVAEYTGPTNKVLPLNIHFPPKHPGTTRIVTWNVSGLVACEKKVCSVFL